MHAVLLRAVMSSFVFLLHHLLCTLTRLFPASLRTNHHDVYADLVRDVTRRGKLQLFLESRSTSIRVEAKKRKRAEPVPQGISLENAAALFPTGSRHPFAVPVPLADRLGVFLSDHTVMRSGEFPQPDNLEVFVTPFVSTETADGTPFRVHARTNFYGAPRYSFVEIEAGKERWYGQVWMLFSCHYRGTKYHLAACSVLTTVKRQDYNTTRRTFQWYSKHIECIEVGHILRKVVMVKSFMKGKATPMKGNLPVNADVFHLLC